MSNTSTSSVKTLRKAVKAATAARVKYDDGTVVRFRYDAGGARPDYTFAAMFVAATGFWYLTGAGSLLDRTMTDDRFVEVLASDAVYGVRVATAWETL